MATFGNFEHVTFENANQTPGGTPPGSPRQPATVEQRVNTIEQTVTRTGRDVTETRGLLETVATRLSGSVPSGLQASANYLLLPIPVFAVTLIE